MMFNKVKARLIFSCLALALGACVPGARLPRDTPVEAAQGFPGAPVPLPNPSYAVSYANCAAALTRLSGFRTVGRDGAPLLICYLVPVGDKDPLEVIAGVAAGYREAGYTLASEVSGEGLVNQLWLKESAKTSLDVSYWLDRSDGLLMSVSVQTSPRAPA